MLEHKGDLADKSRRMSIGWLSWFDSDLSILEPTNSIQLADFEQLKVTGLLCSRYSASVQGGRRCVGLAVPDPEEGSQAEAEVQLTQSHCRDTGADLDAKRSHRYSW